MPLSKYLGYLLFDLLRAFFCELLLARQCGHLTLGGGLCPCLRASAHPGAIFTPPRFAAGQAPYATVPLGDVRGLPAPVLGRQYTPPERDGTPSLGLGEEPHAGWAGAVRQLGPGQPVPPQLMPVLWSPDAP